MDVDIYIRQCVRVLNDLANTPQIDVPVMKGRNTFFKLYHLQPFNPGTSR